MLPPLPRLGFKTFPLSLRGAPATWQSRPTKFLRQRLGTLDRHGLRPRDDGFSLVELSIVLVILGLLVGGVLSGQSLIRAAELRAVSTEYARYTTAIQSFRDKYFALPGDMANATQFWGAAHPTPATCRTTQGVGGQTCDGDGDGLIRGSVGSDEHFRAWQQMANAQLIEGSYVGVRVGSDSLGSNATNIPRSKIANGLWFLYDYAVSNGNGLVFNGQYGNAFELGAASPTQHPYFALMRPEEVWNIDTKIDDGRPGSGNLWVRGVPGIEFCTDTSNLDAGASANYLLTNRSVNCSIIIRNVL